MLTYVAREKEQDRVELWLTRRDVIDLVAGRPCSEQVAGLQVKISYGETHDKIIEALPAVPDQIYISGRGAELVHGHGA